MLTLLIALAALPWPLPCADAGTCWLRWDPAARVEWYEVLSDDRLCATLPGRWITLRGGTQVFREPRPVYWPHPGDGCWEPGGSRSYRVIACNEAGCGGSSEAVEFGPQEFRCFTSTGEVPCQAP